MAAPDEDARTALIDSFARHLARARFGAGVDMGGKHNPIPSEYRLAAEMVDEATAYFGSTVPGGNDDEA